MVATTIHVPHNTSIAKIAAIASGLGFSLHSREDGVHLEPIKSNDLAVVYLNTCLRIDPDKQECIENKHNVSICYIDTDQPLINSGNTLTLLRVMNDVLEARK